MEQKGSADGDVSFCGRTSENSNAKLEQGIVPAIFGTYAN
jgi:hypothetical protein